jgi:hypothetical protein
MMNICMPQVGADLELVSKDERELQESKAELEALLLQQRSTQGSTAESPPSTSSAAAAVAAPQRSQRHHQRGGHTPKQATAGIASSCLQLGSAASSADEAHRTVQPAVSRGSSQAVGFPTSSGSPFASISGAIDSSNKGGSPGSGSAPAADTQVVPAVESALAGQGRDWGSSQIQNAQARFETAAGPHSSIPPPVSQTSPAIPVNSSDFSLETAPQQTPSLEHLQGFNSTHAVSQQSGATAAGSAESQPSSSADLQKHGEVEQKQEASPAESAPQENVFNQGVLVSHERPATSQAGVHSPQEQFEKEGVLSSNAASGRLPALAHAAPGGGPNSVRWLRPRRGPDQALQVRKGGPTKDLLRRYSGSAVLGPEPAAEPVQEDRTSAVAAEEGETSQESSASEEAETAVQAVSPPPDAGSPGTDENEDAEDPLEEPPAPGNPLSDSAAAGASTDVAGPQDTSGLSEQAGIFAHVEASDGAGKVPPSHAALDRLVRARQARRAGQPAPRWSSQSWEAKWYDGPAGHAHDHGGCRARSGWATRQPLRRTARSSLRQGRSTLQVLPMWLRRLRLCAC